MGHAYAAATISTESGSIGTSSTFKPLGGD